MIYSLNDKFPELRNQKQKAKVIHAYIHIVHDCNQSKAVKKQKQQQDSC